ncbi:MAG: flippase-like domain-containing protein [Lachnospiraceae bacterium]|nr:flippase-like domain-containing protein [Lachnospiraceae bacterium]
MNLKIGKIIYYLINAAVIVLAVYFLYTRYFEGMLAQTGLQVPLIIGVGLLMALIYAMKAFRLYVIFMDRCPGWGRFIEVYIKTMPAAIAFPLKAGEFFRMYCFGFEMGSLRLGILGILAERFFDTIPLLVLLILFTLISGDTVMPIVVVTAGFIILILAVFLSFPSIYLYINKYCMVSIHSKKSVKLLEMLEGIKKWYDMLKDLIKDRVALLLIISSFTWLAECFVLMIFAWGLGYGFETDLFLTYVNSAFNGQTNEYVNLYVGLSAVLFLLAFIIVYPVRYIKKMMIMGRKKN